MTGYIYMVLSAFFFCLMTIFVKLAGSELDTIQIVFFRGVFTLLTTYYLIKKHKVSIWGKHRNILFLRGIHFKIKSNFDINLRETVEWYKFYLNK